MSGLVVQAYKSWLPQKLRQEDGNFEACLGYRMTLRPVWGPCLKIKTNKQTRLGM